MIWWQWLVTGAAVVAVIAYVAIALKNSKDDE